MNENGKAGNYARFFDYLQHFKRRFDNGSITPPTLAVKHVTDITPEMLHVMKVKGMILDVDNTLSRHGCPIPFEGSIEWTQ